MTRLIPVLVAIVALAFAASKFLDVSATLEHLEDYNWSLFPVALMLSLVYYLLKALRWHYFLGVVGIRMDWRRSVMVYLAGQWFAFAPAGEFARAYMLKSGGANLSVTSSTVTMQILIDLLSLTVVGTLTLLYFHGPALWVVLFGGALVGAITLFSHGPRLPWLPSLPLVSQLRSMLGRPWRGYYEGSQALLGWRPLLTGLAFGIPTILVGAANLFVVCLGYRALGLGAIDAAYVYSVSQLAGAISMLPHGVGAVEASSAVLFGNLGADLDNAAAVIALFRLSTVAWGLLVGGIALAVMRIHNKIAPWPKVQLKDSSIVK